MPNQQHTERVFRVVITPFKMHFGDVSDAMADAFIEELGGFDEDILKAGFRDVVRTCKTKARLAHVVEACEKRAAITGKSGIESPEAQAKYPWNVTDKKMIGLWKSYVEEYLRRPICLEAQQEGWLIHLQRYVSECAYLQAQWISGVRNIGWCHTNIFSPDDPTDSQMRDFLASQKQQALTGHIDVGIPAGKFAQWKAMAEIPH